MQVNATINEEQATVAASLKFPELTVSQVMDGIQRYIANADGRLADEGEQADAALVALAAQDLNSG